MCFVFSNLLRPAGVQLRPATFALNVYKCEDIPRSKFYRLMMITTYLWVNTDILYLFAVKKYSQFSCSEVLQAFKLYKNSFTELKIWTKGLAVLSLTYLNAFLQHHSYFIFFTSSNLQQAEKVCFKYSE